VITNPRPLTTAEVLLLCAGGIALAVLLVRRRRPLPIGIAVALLATVAVTAPFTAWAVGRDALRSRDYSSFRAARVGPEDNGVDTTVVDRIERLIPRDATFEILAVPKLAVDNRTYIFTTWAITELLPRIAVTETSKADWIVSVGAAPSRFGVDVTDVHVIHSARDELLTTWVGRRT
jgi:hypothetical protein